MDLIKKCAEVFKNYVGYNYTFILDCNMSVTAMFTSGQFHHLVGLQYLTDIAQVNVEQPYNSTKRIFKNILNDNITQKLIESSNFYDNIYERLLYFTNFDDIMTAKLIIDFDYTKLPKTKIMSKYLLYKQYDDVYVILGLRYDEKKDIFVPETFIVEHSDYYVKDQTSYNVVDVKYSRYKNKRNWLHDIINRSDEAVSGVVFLILGVNFPSGYI